MTEIKKRIVYSIVAMVCFVILLVMGYEKEKQSSLIREYDIVMLGDSIMGETRDETSVSAQLEQMLGRTVFNGALGGTCMGRIGEDQSYGNVRDGMSMVSLSKSIVGRDFKVQQIVEIKDNGTEYFPETIAQLADIDFSKVKVLMIGHCVNDYHAGEVIFDEENPYNEYTFAGALRSSIAMLQKKYPDLRIVLVTAPYTWYVSQKLTCEEYVRGGNILEDYVNAELVVAKELGIEVIDIYHDVFSGKSWEDWNRYSMDGIHLNEAGRKLLAELIANYFLEHPDKA